MVLSAAAETINLLSLDKMIEHIASMNRQLVKIIEDTFYPNEYH